MKQEPSDKPAMSTPTPSAYQPTGSTLMGEARTYAPWIPASNPDVYYVPFVADDGRVGYMVHTNKDPDATVCECGHARDEHEDEGGDFICYHDAALARAGVRNASPACQCQTYRPTAPDQRETYIYLNPSSDDSDSDNPQATVFVYVGGDNDPALDTPQHFYSLNAALALVRDAPYGPLEFDVGVKLTGRERLEIAGRMDNYLEDLLAQVRDGTLLDDEVKS